MVTCVAYKTIFHQQNTDLTNFDKMQHHSTAAFHWGATGLTKPGSPFCVFQQNQFLPWRSLSLQDKNKNKDKEKDRTDRADRTMSEILLNTSVVCPPRLMRQDMLYITMHNCSQYNHTHTQEWMVVAI